MNGTKGSIIKIDIPQENGENEDNPARKWIRDMWEFIKEDTSRITFSLKVGLAVLLVSLLILIRAPYDVFGTNIIWSILTVAIMFEYTVGATFNRGFNRALGSILAGIFAVAFMQVAITCGQIAEPYIIGISIFLIGTVTSFLKLWPPLVPYEYGFRVILFSYCLIIISGYRMGNPIRTAMNRLYSIAIGGLVAVLVNVLIFPIWAGEQLHCELVSSFNAVADSVEECVKKYLADDGSSHPEFSKTVMDNFEDEPAFHKCRVMLTSSAKFDTLVSKLRMMPAFVCMGFLYPEVVDCDAIGTVSKVGTTARQIPTLLLPMVGVCEGWGSAQALCLRGDGITWLLAFGDSGLGSYPMPSTLIILFIFSMELVFMYTNVCHMRTPSFCVKSVVDTWVNQLQAPYNLRSTFQPEILDATNQAAELLRSLGKDINNMKRSLHKNLLKRVHSSSEQLQRSIDMHSYLLTSTHDDNPAKPQLSNTMSFNSKDLPSQLAESGNNNEKSISPNAQPAQAESYHEIMKKNQRRLYSWPSREVDDFEDGGLDTEQIQKMRAFESTAALSLATFTSLLIEFVARLDHLVDATDILAAIMPEFNRMWISGSRKVRE